LHAPESYTVEALLELLITERSGLVLSLMLAVIALAGAIVTLNSQHRKDRREDRERWIAEVGEGNKQLEKVTAALTQLHLLVAGCSNNRRGGNR
jgi:hypothetical protein